MPPEGPRQYGAVTGHANWNAAVTGEIVGRARRAAPRKITRRANYGDLHRPHYPNGNHVGRRPAEQARVVRSDPGVESLRHDVDRRVTHRELKVDFRVRGQEGSPHRRHDPRRRHIVRIDPQPPQGPLALLVQVLERAGDLADCRPPPRYSSSRLITWPSAEGVTPSCDAAARKLIGTATNAVRLGQVTNPFLNSFQQAMQQKC